MATRVERRCCIMREKLIEILMLGMITGIIPALVMGVIYKILGI